MAPDERDRSFDRALARHLRSDGSARNGAISPSREFSPAGECPDAETLAAYHERSLLPEQLNSCEAHIAGCAHCQTILAQLEATDDISLQAVEQEEVLSAKESAPVLAARSLESLPAAEAPGRRQPATGAASPKKSRRVLLLRGARWRWLAPAGALAASLLVWVALHENQPQPFPVLSKSENKVALNQAPAPPVSSGPPAVREVSPPPTAPARKPPSAVDEIAAAKGRGTLGAMKPSEKQDYLAQASPSTPPADRQSRLRKDAERDPSVSLLRDENQMDRDARTPSGEKQENAEAQLQAQATNVQSQNQSNAVSPKLAAPAPPGRTEAKKMKAAPAAPPASAVGGVAGFNSTASMEVVAISNPRLIAPPGSHVMWRAGRDGLIEFSTNNGTSWSRQTSGVLADLLTGSAPSDKVCWIVGRVGTILRTTDGGAHWTLISSPLPEDLGGVRATDELHASIWNARGTINFETSDGGLTWKRVPNP
jgi:hypothetical protein